jgi:signal transduction histidine kinase/ActR/RegA family two-component response regulator
MTGTPPPSGSPDAIETRILVMPPTRADGEAIAKLLGTAGLSCKLVASMSDFCESIREGGACAVLSEEALLNGSQSLLEQVRRQPIWSELPIIALSRAGHESRAFADIVASLGNVSVVERPVRSSTLLSLIRASQRARRRQYQLRQFLAERDQLFESERAARNEAERASRMKDEFLATLSHELRTPLNAVLGWTQVLKKGPALPEEALKGLGIIERNARAQAQIIEDLLDMSSIISGKVRLDVQRVDLAAVVNATVETVRPAAQARGIRLQMVLDPLAGPVRGDPNRLQQILWNLLTNSVKFTPRDGRVTITLARINSHLEVEVADNGEGIDPAFLPHVFDRFRQADATTTRRHGGLGLGLSIVKQLVELHGGTITAKSAGRGKGSTFRVALPLMPANGEMIESPGAREYSKRSVERHSVPECDSVTLDGLVVLVVDDEPDSLALIRRILEECNAQVIAVASAAEAFERFERQIPDVIVSDIGMPEQDGYSLIQQIRAREDDIARVPAIALTAYARIEDRLKAIRAGFQLHLSKPVEPIELVSMIQSLARRPKQS